MLKASFIRLYEFRYGDYGIPAGSAQVHRSSPRLSDVAARTCGFPILGRPPYALAHAHSQTPPPAVACQVAAPVPALAGRCLDRDLDSVALRTLRPAAPSDRRVAVDGGGLSRDRLRLRTGLHAHRVATRSRAPDRAGDLHRRRVRADRVAAAGAVARAVAGGLAGTRRGVGGRADGVVAFVARIRAGFRMGRCLSRQRRTLVDHRRADAQPALRAAPDRQP